MMRVSMAAALMASLGAQEPVQKDAAPSREEVYIKTAQGELKIFLYLPPGWKEADKRPAVVFFFGGGWSQGNVKQFAGQSAHLARRGMVAACADYRVKSRHQVTPDKCVEDARSAMRWMRKNAARLGVDPDRIAAGGGSAGGHLAACTATVEGIDAAVEDSAVSCRPNALLLFNPALDMVAIGERFGLDADTAKKISPSHNLKKDLPPAIVFFGTADRLLDPAKVFVEKSKELGNRVELETAADQPHGYFNRAPWLEKTLARADEFLVSLGWLEAKK